MKTPSPRQPRTILRIGPQSLRFALPSAAAAVGGAASSGAGSPPPVSREVEIEPYTVKSGMSMAANLREAFRESDILTRPAVRACVLADVAVSLIPLEEWDESQAEALHFYAFPRLAHEFVMHCVVPDLNCVAVFSVNKDVRTVVTDHFSDVRFMPLVVPVWQHLHRRSYSGMGRKLYAYLHDGQLSIAAFRNNRFRFANTFEATETTDTAYYIMYTWQQLALDAKRDELYIVGDLTPQEPLRDELRRYLQNVYLINPSAEFNRAPVTRAPQATYDIICLCES